MAVINDPDHLVPDKTIAVIPLEGFDFSKLSEFMKPLRDERKRDWFDKHFYRCLPLAIGNTYGFIFYLPFDLNVFWSGYSNPEALVMRSPNDQPFRHTPHVGAISHFGHGILTVELPIMLRTPPHVNLMTISPPNYPLAGLSPLTGVIESDNLRHTFSLNIRVNVVDTWVNIPKNCPIMGLIPVPRYFCDQFVVECADNLFDKETIEGEIYAQKQHAAVRSHLRASSQTKKVDMSYYTGTDIFGNRFADHQLPKN
jgi:hypothetical protein